MPIGWPELVKRTVRETRADNGLGLAAQLSYYFFLALFPALLFLLALTSVFASSDLIARIITMLSGAVPPAVANIIQNQLTKISLGENEGLLTFGVVAALWSSSAAMVALIDALNRAYDVGDERPWWKQRAVAILLTIGVALFILISITLVVAGPELAAFVARRVGLGAAFEWTWKILQWPLVFVLIATAFGGIYYFAPDVEQDFVWLTPGALVATALWIAGSLGFRLYVVHFGSYNETYGAIGGAMVLLLWLYLSGLVIVAGAEMNAEIEHASPHGKAAGEKIPGQKKKVGARAAREFEARQRRRPDKEERTDPMADHDQSISDLIRAAVRDAQDLVASEIALAKAEFREEVRRLGLAAAFLVAAAVAGVLGLTFLLSTLAWGLATAFQWPVWVGFAIVAVLTLLLAAILAYAGRRKLIAGRHLPQTTDTLRENKQWIRARTS